MMKGIDSSEARQTQPLRKPKSAERARELAGRPVRFDSAGSGMRLLAVLQALYAGNPIVLGQALRPPSVGLPERRGAGGELQRKISSGTWRHSFLETRMIRPERRRHSIQLSGIILRLRIHRYRRAPLFIIIEGVVSLQIASTAYAVAHDSEYHVAEWKGALSRFSSKPQYAGYDSNI